MTLGPFSAQANLVKAAVRLHLSATMISGVSLAVAAVFGMLALVFAAISLFFKLEGTMGPTTAALWVAGVAVLIAVLVWLIGSQFSRIRRRLAHTSMNAAVAPLAALGLGVKSAAASSSPPPSPNTHAPSTHAPDTHAMMLDHGMALGARANAALAAHPGRLLAVGLGAGLALGFSPALRRAVRRMFPW